MYGSLRMMHGDGDDLANGISQPRIAAVAVVVESESIGCRTWVECAAFSALIAEEGRRKKEEETWKIGRGAKEKREGGRSRGGAGRQGGEKMGREDS